MVYNRWGRVGIKGQDKLHGPYTCMQSALDEFEHKFHAKTKNYWSERKQFISNPKCYTWLEMDYNEVRKETVVSYFYFLCFRVIFTLLVLTVSYSWNRVRKT